MKRFDLKSLNLIHVFTDFLIFKNRFSKATFLIKKSFLFQIKTNQNEQKWARRKRFYLPELCISFMVVPKLSKIKRILDDLYDSYCMSHTVRLGQNRPYARWYILHHSLLGRKSANGWIWESLKKLIIGSIIFQRIEKNGVRVRCESGRFSKGMVAMNIVMVHEPIGFDACHMTHMIWGNHNT